MSDIFLSYKSEDRQRAKIIAEALEQHGYSVWWDRIIPPGKTFDEVIEQELEVAKCVIVLWSKESVKSDWVKNEAREGARRHILIPVLIDEVKIPFEFKHIQAANLVDFQGMLPNPEFDLLLISIADIVGQPPAQKLKIKESSINELKAQKRRNEESLQKEKEERERLKREEEQREIEEARKREQEAQERVRRQKEKEEQERLRREEAERKERERQRARQEEERLRIQKEEQERIAREREEFSVGERGTSYKKFFAIALVLGVLVLGYWGLAPKPLTAPIIMTLPPDIEKNFTNSIGMEFVLIPAGEFDMGSPSNEADRNDDEGPVHRVKISNAFYMGKYEVTQNQWREVMGTSPSYFKGDNLPVENVSWNDVQEFVKKLNEKEGTNKYRLPSEAEWEYAVRAGTTTRYSFGDDKSMLYDYAWYYGNSGDITGMGNTHEVGQKKPNPWGLYDMHGNVLEWVQDSWHSDYNGAPTDGSAWESGNGSDRVSRGNWMGAWTDCCRSAARSGYDPGATYYGLGFRLLRIL
jgi:formylglycine-generating enzyme required for sulfatase activity